MVWTHLVGRNGARCLPVLTLRSRELPWRASSAAGWRFALREACRRVFE